MRNFFVFFSILAISMLWGEPRSLTSREIVIPDGLAIAQPEADLILPNNFSGQSEPINRDDWIPMLELEMDMLLRAGEQYGIMFDSKDLFAQEYSTEGYTLTETGYAAAVERAPSWIRAELRNTLLQLDYYRQMAFSSLILDAPDPLVDEIAFCVATSSPLYLNSDFAYTELFLENAQWIYSIAAELPYVEIVDTGSAAVGGDYWSTTRYWKKDANGQLMQVSVPREIYYWYLVQPKITDEIAAYINPAIVENNSSHSNNIVAPWEGGKFWRSYFYDYEETGYPVLSDTLSQCQSLFNRDGSPGDAARAVIWWINQNMSFTSNNERPHQPVRIFEKRFGRCGEYADFTSAVARTALIPCTNISSVSTDHTWNEFWEDGWVSWEPVNGYLNNPLVYENGWGKVFGSVFEERCDGLFTPVTDRYSEGSATINIQVVDQNLLPVDGARVVLAIFETSVRFDSESYTDNSGMVSFAVGENRDYRARAETMFGIYPANPGTYAQLVSSSVDGETYNYQFQIAAPLPQPTIEALAPPADPEQDYRFWAIFQSDGYSISGKTLWDDIDVLGAPASYYKVVDTPGTVSFLMADGDNALFLDLDNFCSAHCYQSPSSAGSAQINIPANQNWYMILDNSHRYGNAVRLSGFIGCDRWGSAADDPQVTPELFRLSHPSPNPSVGPVKLTLDLKQPTEIYAAVYNVRGQKIREIDYRQLASGNHDLVWDGQDDSGVSAPEGLYLLKVSGGGRSLSRKLVRLR